ncbi:MAG: hypothetical protein COU68_01595 [Candidatus Pacebacteria bacterium CG10_big_fil_rev_8_21_14_0_10_45_6]|nr:MAG: hypothetical protein COU68_01595 [Candidatus Pacebacteria bacterium CG10_big_fil_rev_8_21_14_0_10_45_6]
MNYNQVAIIIPTYNERTNIVSLVREILQVIPGTQVVVVDDNSPDGTAKIISESFAKNKSVCLVKRTKKQGRGAAVLAGFHYANKQLASKIYIEMDADHSHEPQLLPALISRVNATTVVCASRYLPGASISNWSKLRSIFSWLSNSIIRLLLHSSLTDNTNGYRAYPIAAVRVLLTTKLSTKNYLVLAETTKLLTKHGFKYEEVPSHFSNRVSGKSNTTLSLLLRSISDLVKIWLQSK